VKGDLVPGRSLCTVGSNCMIAGDLCRTWCAALPSRKPSNRARKPATVFLRMQIGTHAAFQANLLFRRACRGESESQLCPKSYSLKAKKARLQLLAGGLGRQLVGAIIVLVIGMALGPGPVELVPLHLRI